MRVLITGGGTGGHIYPALAVAQALLKKYPHGEILYLGSEQGLEARIVPEAGIPFRALDVEGLPRKISWQSAQALIKAQKGFRDAWKIIKEFKPQVVMGTGGYVCGPVVLAAGVLQIPTAIHEQNALPGITNKLLAKIADKVLLTFPQSKKHLKNNSKTIVTGLPVREEILQMQSETGYQFLNLEAGKKTLLVTGGSRGALSINKAMLQVYPKLLAQKDLQLIHLTGEFGFQDFLIDLQSRGINIQKHKNLILKPYLNHMEYALAIADFYVARAGATFIAEVTARGVPGILVPYPYAAENHQQFNAQALVDQGAALMILNKDLTGQSLYMAIMNILDHGDQLEAMKNKALQAGNTDALAKIIHVLEELCGK